MLSNSGLCFGFAVTLGEQVATKENAFAAEDLVDDIRRLGADAQPVASAVNIQYNGLGRGHRIDVPHAFDSSAVTTSASVDRNDVIEGGLLTTAATQAEFYHG